MKKILVMGTGGYYQNKKKSVDGNIIAYVDNFKEGEFEGKPIIKPEDIKNIEYDCIYVMSVQFCLLVRQLLDIGVDYKKIIIGANLKPYNNIEKGFIDENRRMMITPNQEICYATETEQIIVRSYDELVNVKEIFGDRSYNFYVDSDCVVMDIGANIGGASVWFSHMSNVKKIYAYEPFHETCDVLQKNIELNEQAQRKVSLYPVGLGEEAKESRISYNSNMSCGVSVLEDVNQKAFDMYEQWGLIDKKQTKSDTINIIDIAKEFRRIKLLNPSEKLVVKMDCEGSEYKLFDRLQEEDLLGEISVLMMEWHYNGSGYFESLLEENGFSYFSFNKSDFLGTIYAIKK